MCEIYAGTDPGQYEMVTRSIRIDRQVTSLRLEARFWHILAEMAQNEGLSLARFVGVLHDEVLERRGEVRNFASLLRVCCSTYLQRKAEAAAVGRAA